MKNIISRYATSYIKIVQATTYISSMLYFISGNFSFIIEIIRIHIMKLGIPKYFMDVN